MPTRGWIVTGIVLEPTQSVDVSEYVFDPEDGDATHEFGFTLGGPLWRDRAWFFGGFLSEVRNRTRSVTFTSGEAGRFQPKDRLRSSPVRIDFQPAEKVRFMTSFVADRSDWKGGLPHRDGTSNPAFEWAKEGFEYPGYTLTGAAMITLSPFLAVDARWGLNAIQTEQLLGPDQVRHAFPESPGRIGYSPDEALYRPRGFSTIGHVASFNTSQDFQTFAKVLPRQLARGRGLCEFQALRPVLRPGQLRRERTPQSERQSRFRSLVPQL